MSSLENLVKTRTYRERSQAQGDNYSFFYSAALSSPPERFLLAVSSRIF